MAGRLTRLRFAGESEAETKGGVNSLLGALFGLWAFMLAFTFSNSAARFNEVRNLMVDEANIMRNTILRSGFFPDSIGNDLRVNLRTYLEASIDYYDQVSDIDRFKKAKEDAAETGKTLLKKIMQLSNHPDMKLLAGNMFSSLTNLFDIHAKRDSLVRAGVPEPIQYLLFFLALSISFIGGFTTPFMKRKEWIVIAGFTLLAVAVIYVTLDMGRPLRGFIRTDIGQVGMIELRKLF